LDALTLDENGWTEVCHWIHERRKLTRLTGRNQLRRAGMKRRPLLI
jgi:hypothetical protein